MAFGPQILVNPDFETGLLTPWTQTGTPETLEVVPFAGSEQCHVIESAAEVSGFGQTFTAVDGAFMVLDFDYVVVSGALRVTLDGGTGGQAQLTGVTGSGTAWLGHSMGTGSLAVHFRSDNVAGEFYIDNVRLRRQVMALATAITLTVRDGKGHVSNPSVHVLSTTILDDLIEYGQEFATLVDAVITGEIIAISATIRIALPGALDAVAANSDVEEGAMFIMDAAGGVKSRLRVPTFDEAMMVSGSQLVDLTDADVIALVGILEDGFTTTTPTDVDTVEYREADIETVQAAYDAFTKSR